MHESAKRKSWREEEKYQILLAYRLGACVADIAQAVNRSEKSVYRALERFQIILPGTPKGRPVSRNKTYRYGVAELKQLFRTCGLSLDPVFDKGFFRNHVHGKTHYQPTPQVRRFWDQLNVKLEAPWYRSSMRVAAGRYSTVSRLKDYNMQDLLRFMKKSGTDVQQVDFQGQKYFLLKGRKHTPSTLLYCANKLRLQRGLERMCVLGITQD